MQQVGNAIQAIPRFLDHHIYSDPGIRYATEQTVCFTLPRTVVQVNRNIHETGLKNVLAGWERFLNDFSADILDTFAPGAIAYLGISRWLDKRKGTITHAMMGQQAMGLYSHIGAEATSQADFYHRLESYLHTHGSATPTAAKPALNLQATIQELMEKEAARAKVPLLKRWFSNNPIKTFKTQKAQQLASQLGHTQLELTLPYADAFGHEATRLKRQASIAIPDLLSDLKIIQRHLSNAAPHANQLKTTEAFGKRLVHLMDTTHTAAKHHMWANAMALVASLAMPFISRLITKAVAGDDRNPATQALQEHYGTDSLLKKAVPHPHRATATFGQQAGDEKEIKQPWWHFGMGRSATNSSTKKASVGRFVWFPYLSECWKEGKITPMAITAAFFGALGFMVNRRFSKQGLSFFKPKDLLKVYEFQRGFPWTTVAQMELTYGLLCGFRLLSARDQGDWQEAALRDAFLGWPTLTYGFEAIRKGLMRGGNTLLKKVVQRGSQDAASKFHNLTIPETAQWMSHGVEKNAKFWQPEFWGTPRARDEITQELLTHTVPASWSLEAVGKLTQYTQRVQEWITLASAAMSVTLLSYLEPKWGIQMTTALETKRYHTKLGHVIRRLTAQNSNPSPSMNVNF